MNSKNVPIVHIGVEWSDNQKNSFFFVSKVDALRIIMKAFLITNVYYDLGTNKKFKLFNYYFKSPFNHNILNVKTRKNVCA